MVRATSVRPSPSTAATNENAPAVAGALKEFAKPRAKQTAPNWSASLRDIVQARRTAARVMEIDDIIGEGLPAPLDVVDGVLLYCECWTLVEASTPILSADFEAIVGVRRERLVFALHALGWALLTEKARQRRRRGGPNVAAFITPAELAQ